MEQKLGSILIEEIITKQTRMEIVLRAGRMYIGTEELSMWYLDFPLTFDTAQDKLKTLYQDEGWGLELESKVRQQLES